MAQKRAITKHVTLAEMRAHIDVIASQHQIVVIQNLRRLNQCYSLSEEIYIAPVKSQLSYAMALHELGHQLGKNQSSKSVRVRERAAWAWARKNGLLWTQRMETYERESLAWYDKNFKKIDARWQPEEIIQFNLPNDEVHNATTRIKRFVWTDGDFDFANKPSTKDSEGR